MKRYFITGQGRTVRELADDGLWVRATDALKLQAVIDALPKCDGPDWCDLDDSKGDPEECGAIATFRTTESDVLEYYCDKHVSLTTGYRKATPQVGVHAGSGYVVLHVPDGAFDHR